MLTLKQQIAEHPLFAPLFLLLSTLIKFCIESLAADGVAYILLMIMIGFDTYQGIKLAKLKGLYKYQILREKTIKKVKGQLVILACMWVFTMMLFVLNFMAGEKGISYSFLNIPMMTIILFYGGVEFLSIKDKVKEIYGIITPASIVEKVEDFVNTGNADKLLSEK